MYSLIVDGKEITTKRMVLSKQTIHNGDGKKGLIWPFFSLDRLVFHEFMDVANSVFCKAGNNIKAIVKITDA